MYNHATKVDFLSCIIKDAEAIQMFTIQLPAVDYSVTRIKCLMCTKALSLKTYADAEISHHANLITATLIQTRPTQAVPC